MPMMHGYIDDSGEEGKYFALSCVHSAVDTCFWLEHDWLQMLKGVNRRLRTEGRKELILDSKDFGGRNLGLNRGCLKDMKHVMDGLDTNVKDDLLRLARVPKARPKGGQKSEESHPLETIRVGNLNLPIYRDLLVG